MTNVTLYADVTAYQFQQILKDHGISHWNAVGGGAWCSAGLAAEDAERVLATLKERKVSAYIDAPEPVACRTCDKELTPEHFHEDNYPFKGEDGY